MAEQLTAGLAENNGSLPLTYCQYT